MSLLTDGVGLFFVSDGAAISLGDSDEDDTLILFWTNECGKGIVQDSGCLLYRLDFC